MVEIKFIPLTYKNGIRTYIKADAIIQVIEQADGSSVYTINSDAPMFVKESMDEIVHDLLTL